MQFNSCEFILFFLPITVLLYFGANKIKPVWGKYARDPVYVCFEDPSASVAKVVAF